MRSKKENTVTKMKQIIGDLTREMKQKAKENQSRGKYRRKVCKGKRYKDALEIVCITGRVGLAWAFTGREKEE